MTDDDLVARASIDVSAPRARVWHALVTPHAIKQYMFGTTVTSDWTVGSPITWAGEWQGKPYEDRGVILELDAENTLRYSHYIPLLGLPDEPASFHTVTIRLTGDADVTTVRLDQDNNAHPAARDHSAANWTMMLEALKEFVEGSGS